MIENLGLASSATDCILTEYKNWDLGFLYKIFSLWWVTIIPFIMLNNLQTACVYSAYFVELWKFYSIKNKLKIYTYFSNMLFH